MEDEAEGGTNHPPVYAGVQKSMMKQLEGSDSENGEERKD